MPYPSERAHRLGHVPVVNNQAVQDAFNRWQVAQATPEDGSAIAALCTPVELLAGEEQSADVGFAITVDGSDTEVEATREHPTVKVGYLRVAGSIVDLEKLTRAGESEFVNPRLVRDAHQHAAFDGALPGSGLIRPGCSGVDTWRQELNHFLTTTRFDDGSPKTLGDMLLALHGTPDHPAAVLTLRRCPSCGAKDDDFDSGGIPITLTGGTCPKCGSAVYLADVLRTHEEYAVEGSNQSALTRVMLVAERLTTLGYMQLFYDQSATADMLRKTLFITDGPLALFGVVAPLKRRFQHYLGALSKECEADGHSGLPLLVGVEKTGRFVEHAELIRELIPRGSVMNLTTDYINRITGRPQGNEYGTDEFYGRRFVYRTHAGDPLVITVPPKPGILPYEGTGAEDLSSYPVLRPVCEVLDRVRTRLYPNAVIPVALAHSAASLPLGVGQSVLRIMLQKAVGLPQTSQFRHRSPFSGPH